MTLHLAIDTATALGSVAVGRPGAPVAEIVFGDRRHAASAAPAVQEVLRLAGVSWGDITGVVLADGPGSFTGLRIGCALVQGIVRAREQLTLSTAPSLMATAWIGARFHDGPIAALYDAMRGDVFCAVYRFPAGEPVETLLPPTLSRVETLRAREALQPVVAVGDGAALHAEAVRAWTGRAPVAPPEGSPRALALIQLLAVRGATRLVTTPSEFEPQYGRPAEAQRRWEENHGRPLPDTPRDRG